jgi:hypothetical protein
MRLVDSPLWVCRALGAALFAVLQQCSPAQRAEPPVRLVSVMKHNAALRGSVLHSSFNFEPCAIPQNTPDLAQQCDPSDLFNY